MASKVQGKLVVPVWIDDGEVKPLVNDAGELVCNVDISGQTVDIDGQTVDISGQTVDISGQTVDIDGQDVHIDNTSLICSIYTLYAGALRRNPFIFGISDEIGGDVFDVSISAANTTIYGATVSAGEIWVITQLSSRYIGTSPTSYLVRVNGSAGYPWIEALYTPTSLQWYITRCFVIMLPGTKMEVQIGGGTVGDSVLTRYCGYKMDYS